MMKKRLFSMLLVVCMVITLLPTTAFATKGNTPSNTSNVQDSSTPNPYSHTEHDDTCDCTVKCVAANEESDIEVAIKTDCPVCGVVDADLMLCKGKATLEKSSRVATLPLIYVAGNKVTLTNQGDILGNGTCSLEYVESSERWVMTLDNAAINAIGGSTGISVSTAYIDLEIKLIGNNTITTVSGDGIFLGKSNLIITSEGDLEISSTKATAINLNFAEQGGLSYGNVSVSGVSSLKVAGMS